MTIARPAAGYNFTDTSVTVLGSGSIIVTADYGTSAPPVLPVVYIGTVSGGRSPGAARLESPVC